MKRFLLSIAASLAFFTQVKAQDEALFGHYINNPMLINPAYAGFNDDIRIFGHYRSQFSSFPGGSSSYAVSADAALADKVGLGLMLFSDKIGPFQRLRTQMNYAYRYNSKRIKWSAGFSVEYHRGQLDASILSQPLVEGGDLGIVEASNGQDFFDVSFGAVALFDDKLFFSLSSPSLFRTPLGSISNTTTKRSPFQQYILMAGYKLTKNQFTFEPSININKAFKSPFQVEVNLKGSTFNEALIGALTFRPGNTGQIGLMVGTKQPTFQLFYTYSSSTAAISSYARSGHEVTAGFTIAKPEKKERTGKRYRN